MESMNSGLEQLRWGVLSTGGIVRRNWPSMQESAAARLVAVASRELAKAQGFITEMQALHPWAVEPEAVSGYESLLARGDVDAVYVPLPTAVRKEWVIRAAEAGKHVLCEKPCAISARDLSEMLQACERNGVLFMDGVMFMHDLRFASVRGLLDGGSMGALRRITSAFSFRAGDDFEARDIRANPAMEPTGCLGDLGWYCLRAALWAMNWELPQRVSGRVLEQTSGGAIMEFSGELDFKGGVSSAFHCSFRIPGARWLDLAGSGGTLRMADFVLPAPDNDTAWELGYQRTLKPAVAETSSAALMFRRFAVEARKLEIDRKWGEISLKTQQIQDACVLSARLGTAVEWKDGGYHPVTGG